ncbi:MAG: SpaA isopeptide-forming pilin-related protein [Poseidonibacter sp.]|uniref:SpaA isopeptide-forming pilin-related protein n=1 Tax=Poseidonibacter sp. TaxID=2321188 RepID=UPI00359CCF33
MNRKKFISLTIALFMLVQLMVPLNFAGAETTNIVSQDSVKKVTVLAQSSDAVLKDITEIDDYEPQNGDTVTIKIDIVLDALHNYGEGSILTYELPSIFSGVNGSGALGTVGTFNIIDGKVVVTFNSSIRDDANQGLPVTDASLIVGAEYSESNELLEYVLKLPGQDDIIINFKPAEGNSITKEGTAENNGVSSNFVSWVVDVNTELNTLSSASFKDILTQKSSAGKHTFVVASLTVYELNVNAKGEVSASTTPVAITAAYNTENTEVSFDLPDGKKAYRIEYESKIDENDSDEGEATYENKSYLTNNGNTKNTTDSVTVKWGTPLEKSVVRSNSYGASAEWTVKYNFNRKTIVASSAKLTDKITGDHVIDDTVGVKVYDESNELISSSLYTVTIDADKKGYTLQFNNDVTVPYLIKYTTIKSDYFVSSGTVSNIVTRDNDGKTSKSSFNYSNPAITKSSTGIDYNNKTMDWKIVVNQDSYPMKDVVITDTYAGEGMDYKDGTLNVTGLTEGQYTFTDNGETGFTFTLTPGLTINTPFTIRFTTDYKIYDVGTNERTYKNTSAVKWYVGEKEYNSSATAQASIDAKQKANGFKNGAYNYETKKFNWTALINFNSNTLEEAIFKDSLPAEQEVILDTIKVQPVTLNADGSYNLLGEPTTSAAITLDPAKNAFEISMGTITGPYVITYTSFDADNFFPDTEGNVKVKNDAYLFDGDDENSKFSAEVTVAYTNETITKEGSGFNNTSLINWNFKLNYSQSQISEVKVVDTVGKDADGNPNQFILEDSFKVYEVKLAGELNNGTPTETKTLVANDIYDVSFDNINGTFTLTFKDEITKAYYIEYQSIFLGAPNESISNEAKLTYTSTSSSFEETTKKDFNYFFSGSGSTKKVQLKLVKVDDRSDEKLNGAEFSLYNSNNIKLMEGTTDVNGEILFPLKIGEGIYNLVETKAPEGYFTNDNQTIILNVDSSVDGVQTELIYNTKTKADIELIKQDENGPLSGAEFTLLNGDEIVGTAVTSGSDGKIVFKDVENGIYTIRETKAPTGYKAVNDIKVEVVITESEKKVEIIFNDGIGSQNPFIVTDELVDVYGDVVLNKTDSVGNPLPGAEFTIYDSEQTAVETATSDENGDVKFEHMALGTYTIKETKAPDGYYKSSDEITAVITRNENLIDADVELMVNDEVVSSVTVENYTIDFEVMKTDKNENPLSGAEFTLYGENDVIVQVVESNDFGEVKFTKVPIGNYVIKETKAPSGYYKSETVVSVEVKENEEPEGAEVIITMDEQQVDGVATFVNSRIPSSSPILGKIAIKKTDENNNVLKGAEFTLYDEDGIAVEMGVTGTDGILAFKEIALGNYIIKETKAPDGYVLSDNETTVKINNGETKTFTFENEKEVVPVFGEIEIIKTDEDGKMISDAWFNLYDENGNVLENMKTVNGRGVFENVPLGVYTIKETQAPEGYELSSEVIKVTVADAQMITFNFKNKLSETGVITTTRGNILINKVDEDSQPLEGAEFALYNESGELLRTVISDINGKVMFDNLSSGTYSVMEMNAPEGYELVSKAKVVEITDAKTYTYKFTNVLSETLIDDPNVPMGWEEIEDPIVPEGNVTLPDTGSILNTWILLVIGIMLILAGTVLIKRKIIG